ncbi:MAG: hypothetical protein L0K48_07605, partial [Bifidobacterium mongoliense]|nr:hypothetical protein [Bifidobacterium mongoliense]
MTSEGNVNIGFTLPISEDDLLDATVQTAGQTILTATDMMIRAGLRPADALRLGAYATLTATYGRRWVRDNFGLNERTERLWAAQVRDAAAALPDEADQRANHLAVSAANALA